MDFDNHENLVLGTITVAPSPPASGTTLSMSSGDAEDFPDPAAVGEYNVTIWPANEMPQLSNAEIVRITAKDEDEFTITREQEETSARTILVGDKIAITITKKVVKDIEDAMVDLDSDQEITGAKTFKKTVQTIVTATDQATVTFDLSLGNLHKVTLGGSRTLALSNPSIGQVFMIDLIQGDGGSKTVVWFAGITWITEGGAEPELSTTAGKKDSLGFKCTGTNTYDGYLVGKGE